MSKKLKIVFMGTPEFAVSSLDILVANGYHVVAVVTAPDKPAGRGRKLRLSPIKEYALEHKIPVLQPDNLKSDQFIDQLKSFHPDIQVVVAFRMLPKVVWSFPPKGTFNLHASLLPQYRGAAPINWAIINGEEITGVTTFYIDDKIDTGQILLNKKVEILPHEDAANLHDKLKFVGAKLVLQTVKEIEKDSLEPIKQDGFLKEGEIVKPAPKIFKDDCKVDWSKPRESVRNLIRGLSPYPCAYTTLVSEDGEKKTLKLYKVSDSISEGESASTISSLAPGEIWTDNKRQILAGCQDGVLSVIELQIEGKRKMKVEEFLRGFDLSGQFHLK